MRRRQPAPASSLAEPAHFRDKGGMRAAAPLALALSLSLAALLLACGDDVAATTMTTADDGDTGTAEPQVTFEATVDQLALCGVIGAQNLILKAHRVGCVGSPPAPCTLPTDPYKMWIGEVAACPSASTAALMRVTVPMSGRYHVEVVTSTETGSVGNCYGIDGEALLEITDADLEARAVIGVADFGGPCPNL